MPSRREPSNLPSMQSRVGELALVIGAAGSASSERHAVSRLSCHTQRPCHAGMIDAVKGDCPRMPDHGLSAGIGRQLHIEALVARRRAMLEHVAIDPDDRVADTNSCRRGTELHLVNDDRVHVGCGCRRAGGGQSQDGSRYCKKQWSNGREPSNRHRSFAASCSACFWCSSNRVRPVSRSDLSWALCAPGISVVFSAPFTVR